jgi:hypothetical protein
MNYIYLAGAVALLVCSGCSGPNARVATHRNQTAALSGDIPENPLQWKVITSSAGKARATMSTLFGNETAVAYARSKAQHDYPPGSSLALVTWRQQEDSRWFGGSIPQAPLSVEVVAVIPAAGPTPAFSYREYEGAPLKAVPSLDASLQANRIAAILSQRAAVMP